MGWEGTRLLEARLLRLKTWVEEMTAELPSSPTSHVFEIWLANDMYVRSSRYALTLRTFLQMPTVGCVPTFSIYGWYLLMWRPEIFHRSVSKRFNTWCCHGYVYRMYVYSMCDKQYLMLPWLRMHAWYRMYLYTLCVMNNTWCCHGYVYIRTWYRI